MFHHDATECTKCGTPLWERRSSSRSAKREEECFGAPGCFRPWFGRAATMVFGVFIVFIGLLLLLGEYMRIEVWPMVIIFFGVVAIIGGYLAYTRG